MCACDLDPKHALQRNDACPTQHGIWFKRKLQHASPPHRHALLDDENLAAQESRLRKVGRQRASGCTRRRILPKTDCRTEGARISCLDGWFIDRVNIAPLRTGLVEECRQALVLRLCAVDNLAIAQSDQKMNCPSARGARRGRIDKIRRSEAKGACD